MNREKRSFIVFLFFIFCNFNLKINYFIKNENLNDKAELHSEYWKLNK